MEGRGRREGEEGNVEAGEAWGEGNGCRGSGEGAGWVLV